jgi:hypothetical protein
LVRLSDDRYELPEYVLPLVPLPPDPKGIFDRIIEMLHAQLDRRPMTLTDRELAGAETVMQFAQRFDWRIILGLAPPLARSLALRGAFGAWERVLRTLSGAAKRANDAVMLNAAQHDLGVESLLLARHRKARTLLRAAATQREQLGDHVGASVSASLLAYVREIAPEATSLSPLPETERPRPGPTEPRLSPERQVTSQRIPSLGRNGPNAPPRTRRRAALRGLRVPPRMWFVAPALAGIAVLAFLVLSRSKAVPTIAQFSTSQASIEPGSTAQLCVRATGATFVAISPDIGAVSAKGKQCITVAPAATTSYTAMATNSKGQEVRRTITVAVRGALRPFKINAFAATPARIEAGQSTRLCYDVSGADLLRIVPKLGDLNVLHACRTITLSEPHRYTYDLVAWGPNGKIAVRRAQVDVVARALPASSPAAEPSPNPAATVAAAPAPTAPNTPAATVAAARTLGPAAQPPDDHLAKRAVYQFDATPAVVERGQAASLCVGVGRWAQGDVTAIGTLEPGVTRCYRVKPSETTVYRLHVALDKSVAYETVTVAVRQPPRRHEANQ